MPASLLATGRGWAHSLSTVAAIGAWKESEWLEIQEASCDRFRQSASNGVAPATALKAQGVKRENKRTRIPHLSTTIQTITTTKTTPT